MNILAMLDGGMMKYIISATIILIGFMLVFGKGKNMNYNKLTAEEESVIIKKGTERAFTGRYYQNKEQGIYFCRQCNAPLYRSDDKFESGCGWPSFDDEIEGAVKKIRDKDGERTEIVCNNCGGHLGHVFTGERFTAKNTRHCVNSISLNFIPAKNIGYAYFAAGCFWGVQHYLSKENGVLHTESGYSGGDLKNPTYEQVCSGNSGHAETVMVIYDKSKTDFEKLSKLFFEIHDFGQFNRQGPDVGNQYRGAIFFTDLEQKKTANKLITLLKDKGYNVATELSQFEKFYPAEKYHQNYYDKKGGEPYCHIRKKIF